MTTEQEFEPILDVVEVRRMTTTARTKEIDMVWAERISHLNIGQAFKAARPDAESVRQFKKRINAAAGHTGRTLDWTTLDPQKDPNSMIEPSKFLAKIKAVNVVPAEAAQEAPETPSENGTASASDSSENATETAPEASTGRSGRNR